MLEEAIEAALREVVASRAALASLEASLVVQARSRGGTWSELARPLGLSKQAVRKRHLEIDPVLPRRARNPQTIEEFHAEFVAAMRAQGISLG